jgi:signal transduction histidine kinase
MLLLEVRASLDHALKELRRNIDDLEPDVAGRERLQLSLKKLKVLAHLDNNVRVEIRVDDGAETALISRAQRVHLLYFASEAFSNALRHGRATVLELHLSKTDDAFVHLTIGDNGTGFSPADSRNPFGQGLSNLRERAVQLGGDLVVDSAPGRGTRLRLSFQPK